MSFEMTFHDIEALLTCRESFFVFNAQ